MIDLTKLAEHINKAGIMQKSFYECSEADIHALCNAVINSFDDSVPVDGWQPPCIVGGELIISVRSHPKYHWWRPKGQSILDTLIELGADWDVAEKYIAKGFGTKYTEDEYLNLLIPF